MKSTSKHFQFWGVFVAAFLACLILSTAQAQPPPRAVLDRYEAASIRTINMLLRKIQPNLTDAQRRILSQIHVSVSYSGNVFAVYASNDANGRAIEISVGFIMAMELVQDGALIAMERGNKDEFMNYVRYVTSTMFNAQRAGRPPSKGKIFAEFMGMSQNEIESLYRDGSFQNKRVAIKVHTLALVLGHELAHHFLGHLDRGRSRSSKVEKRAEEAAADEFAVSLAIKSEYSPLLAAWPFVFYAALEEARGAPNDTDRDHPLPICRAHKVLASGIEAAEADTGFMKHLDETGGRSRWEALARVDLDQMRRACEGR